MSSAAGRRLAALGVRRPGLLGSVLLLPTWIALGALLVAYVVAMLALAFLAVLVATLRLLLTPPLSALGRAFGRPGPDARTRTLRR